MRDEIIAEVRRFRDELSAQHDYDIRRIVESIKEEEASGERTHVTLQPRLVRPKTEASSREQKHQRRSRRTSA